MHKGLAKSRYTVIIYILRTVYLLLAHLVFTPDLIKFGTGNVHKILCSNQIFVNIWVVRAIILLGGLNRILPPTFHIYYPIWVNFGVRYLHIVLLNVKLSMYCVH